MEITRKSIISGEVRTRDLPVTETQYALYLEGALIQDAFPQLNADDREFILTGITAEEWNETLGGAEDDAPPYPDEPAF